MMNDFLPNMRGLVSHDLHEKGQSQRKIAQLLGITQARVSYYLQRRRSQFSSELTNKFGISLPDLQNYSKLLAEDVTRSRTDGNFTLYSIWRNLLFNGIICTTHQRESDVPMDCSVCLQVFKPTPSGEPTTKESEDAKIIHDVTMAVSMLESSVYFPNIMPEVSVNIAMSRDDPKLIEDVAAVPGRINKIHGRAKAFVFPEFGSSKHMSKVLLLANSKNPEIKAVLNIKYDETLSKILDQVGIPKRYTSAPKGQHTAYQGEDPVLQRLAQIRLTQERDSARIALVDRGSEGVEPMTYLLGQSASELAQISLKISQEYSKRPE